MTKRVLGSRERNVSSMAVRMASSPTLPQPYQPEMTMVGMLRPCRFAAARDPAYAGWEIAYAMDSLPGEETGVDERERVGKERQPPGGEPIHRGPSHHAIGTPG